MNSFDTLLFPDTNIFNEKYYPLLLFCSPLHYLQPVEPGPESDIYHESSHFLKRGLCQGHSSISVGRNRERFLNLIRNIVEEKEEYATQLRALVTNSLSAPGTTTHSTIRNEIVSHLLQKYSVEHKTTESEMELWQARLLLAIADTYDSEEEALSEELLLFDEDEIAALNSLPRESDSNGESIFDELGDMVFRLEKSQVINNKKRFEAWLCLLKNHPLPSIKLWLASSRDSGERIFQKYKTTGNDVAVPLLKLALPAHISASGKYVVKQIEAFQRATDRIHMGLVADFERIATTVPYQRGSQESLLPYGTDWAEQWEFALDEHFPASSDGRKSITFYLLVDQPVARLLSLPKTVAPPHAPFAHGLLGILGDSQ